LICAIEVLRCLLTNIISGKGPKRIDIDNTNRERERVHWVKLDEMAAKSLQERQQKPQQESALIELTSRRPTLAGKLNPIANRRGAI
jgi:hypothetical protein